MISSPSSYYVVNSSQIRLHEPWFQCIERQVCLRVLFDPTAEDVPPLLDCSFSTMSMCRWMGDARDESAIWRVLFTDKWTGESVCMYRFQGYSRRSRSKAKQFLKEVAVAKLWSPYVEPQTVQCLRFAYRFENGGRLSVLKHKRGWDEVWFYAKWCRCHLEAQDSFFITS